MCLYVIEGQDAPTEKKELFKVLLKKDSNRLFGPWRTNFEYKPGLNIAIGEPEFIDRGFTHSQSYSIIPNGALEGGVLHCCINESHAKNYRKRIGMGFLYIVKVYGEPEDFIAFGERGEVAYKKLFLPEEEYYKLIPNLN